MLENYYHKKDKLCQEDLESTKLVPFKSSGDKTLPHNMHFRWKFTDFAKLSPGMGVILRMGETEQKKIIKCLHEKAWRLRGCHYPAVGSHAGWKLGLHGRRNPDEGG